MALASTKNFEYRHFVHDVINIWLSLNVDDTSVIWLATFQYLLNFQLWPDVYLCRKEFIRRFYAWVVPKLNCLSTIDIWLQRKTKWAVWKWLDVIIFYSYFVWFLLLAGADYNHLVSKTITFKYYVFNWVNWKTDVINFLIVFSCTSRAYKFFSSNLKFTRPRITACAATHKQVTGTVWIISCSRDYWNKNKHEILFDILRHRMAFSLLSPLVYA